MADDPSVILAGIRERARIVDDDAPGDIALWVGALGSSQEDVPRLAAAVEAVLHLADGARAALSACGVGGPCSCGEHPIAWTLDPAKVREAITAALTEGDAGDAGT